MHVQDIMYYLFWAGLVFVMMRFGYSARIVGHSHHKNASALLAANGPKINMAPQAQVTDPICKMTLPVSAAKTTVHNGQVYYFCSAKCR